MTLTAAFVQSPSEMLALKPPREGGRSGLSFPPFLFEGPSLVVSLSTCNNCGGGGGEDILILPT